MTREEALDQLRRLPPLLRAGKEPDDIGWWEGREQQEDGSWLESRWKGLEVRYRGKNKMDGWRIAGVGETWEDALADLRAVARTFAQARAARGQR